MDRKKWKYVFGPVVSRRLGRSLGIDVVPFKTCSYNCVYCQLGPSCRTTLERKEHVPLSEVLAEVQAKADEGVECDYVTLSGSGEPTLFEPLGLLLSGIKKRLDAPLAVITNGSLLWDKAVQKALDYADLIIPSLDAGDAETFARINRPDKGITFEKMVDGLKEFCAQFKGRIWIEVLLAEGINASDEQIEKIAGIVNEIGPEKVQLNSVVRPPAESRTQTVSSAQLAHFADIIGANAEIIVPAGKEEAGRDNRASVQDVLGLIKRHPSSLDDVSSGLGIASEEAQKHLAELLESGEVMTEKRHDIDVYFVRQP